MYDKTPYSILKLRVSKRLDDVRAWTSMLLLLLLSLPLALLLPRLLRSSLAAICVCHLAV